MARASSSSTRNCESPGSARALGRLDVAATHLREARTLFPDAQSILVAESQLALVRGDAAGAPARELADQAVANNAEAVTEYLNAQERRVIHVTLRDDARVKTYAIGDGLIKKLAVAPTDQPEGSREAD